MQKIVEIDSKYEFQSLDTLTVDSGNNLYFDFLKSFQQIEFQNVEVDFLDIFHFVEILVVCFAAIPIDFDVLHLQDLQALKDDVNIASY